MGSSFELPDNMEQVGANYFATAKVGQSPLATRLATILAKQKAEEAMEHLGEGGTKYAAAMSGPGTPGYEEAIQALTADIAAAATAMRELEPMVDDQGRAIDKATGDLIEENDDEKASAETMNHLMAIYNLAVPPINAGAMFVKNVAKNNADATKVNNYEAGATGTYEEELEQMASAVMMVDQVLAKLKKFTMPKVVNINISQEALYSSSDRISSNFNAVARRLVGLQNRHDTLKREYTKAQDVIGILTTYATERTADASASTAAPAAETPVPAPAPAGFVQLNATEASSLMETAEKWTPETVKKKLEDVKEREMRMYQFDALNSDALAKDSIGRPIKNDLTAHPEQLGGDTWPKLDNPLPPQLLDSNPKFFVPTARPEQKPAAPSLLSEVSGAIESVPKRAWIELESLR